jgi:tripartite-type tricarboxylate transporter receptor subunit TctC
MYLRKTFVVLLALSISMMVVGHTSAAYPEKGRRITMVVASGIGGGADLVYRLLAKGLEKELGTNIEIINRPEAGNQVGLQTLSSAKPDGYTIGQVSLPTAILIHLNPQRKAQFNSKSFEPISMVTIDPGATAVRGNSPYKTMKDLIDAAKANPGKIKMGAGGKATRQHLDVIQLEQMTGASFLKVNADSGEQPVTMMLGGHLDAVHESVGDFLNLVKSGELRILGVWDKKESPLAPGTRTMQAQGYNLPPSGASRGVAAPVGISSEMVNSLDAAVKKVMGTAEFKDGLTKLGQVGNYMDRTEYAAYWKETEAKIAPLLPLVLQ